MKRKTGWLIAGAALMLSMSGFSDASTAQAGTLNTIHFLNSGIVMYIAPERGQRFPDARRRSPIAS